MWQCQWSILKLLCLAPKVLVTGQDSLLIHSGYCPVYPHHIAQRQRGAFWKNFIHLVLLLDKKRKEKKCDSVSNYFLCKDEPPDITRSVMISFVALFDTLKLKRKFNSLGLDLKDFLMWVGKTTVPASKSIMSKMDDRVSWRNFKLKNLTFWPVTTFHSTRLERSKFAKSSELLWSSTVMRPRMAGFESWYFTCAAFEVIQRFCLTVHDSCSLFLTEIVKEKRICRMERVCRPLLRHSSTFMQSFCLVDKYG